MMCKILASAFCLENDPFLAYLARSTCKRSLHNLAHHFLLGMYFRDVMNNAFNGITFYTKIPDLMVLYMPLDIYLPASENPFMHVSYIILLYAFVTTVFLSFIF